MPSELLSTALKRQRLFIVNGIQYLGTVKKEEDGTIKISEAFKFNVSSESEVFKGWVAARHVGELESFELEGGNNQLTIKDLSEKQKLLIDSVAATAEYAVKYALKEVEKSAILNS